MGEYVNAGGVRTYYELYGEGEPVVMLHGGLATAESWAMQTPALAERYRVYVPERRGHGRTPDVDGPITYETMAADTAAFLDAAGTGAAHLIGWSDGAVVGMLVALCRPELVRKLVVIGQYFNFEGEVPEYRAMIDYWGSYLPETLHEVYDRVSPDGPEHFPVVLEKLMRMWREEPDIALPELAGVRTPALVMQGDDDIVEVEHSATLAATLPDAQLAVVPGTSHMAPLEKLMRMWREEPDIALPELAGVRAPALVMQGDDDIVEVEHSAALAATLPDAQLAVVPGTSHMAPLEKPDLVNRLILDFLDDHQAKKMMTLRG